jgi:NAD(P)-dependent dehydrogenase (short-subunit alcohol dehydrogenase family)
MPQPSRPAYQQLWPVWCRASRSDTGAALFLLSDEAPFVNGVALPVDGGATA